jgi:hypothetical protein
MSHRERRSARFERWRERRIYRLTDRLERRRDHLADRREHLMKNGHRGGLWTRLRHRSLAGSERLELLEELLLIRWNRFLLHVSARWERIPGPASRGGAVVAAGISLTLAIAMVVMLPLAYTARIDSGSPPIVLPPGTALDVGATRGAPAPSTTAVTWEGYANGDLGYRFSYPSDWDLEVSTRATVLSDTADRVVVTFRRAPSGRLGTASDRLLETITAPFSGTATVATETARTAQGYASTSVGGTARDAVGTAIRFLITTISGPHGNHAIVVRFPVEAAAEDLDALVRVIGSFRLD